MRNTLAVLVALLTPLAALTQAPAGDPDWPMYRHDVWLSGRSPLAGRLTAPALQAAYDLRAWDQLVVARLTPGPAASLRLACREREPGYLGSNQSAWGLGAPLRDVAGDGKLVPCPEALFTRYARVLPDRPGLQKIRCDDYFGTGVPEQRKLYAYTYDPGNPEPQPLWESGPWGELEGTMLTVVDADADGLPEIVGNTWGRLFIWNGQTGAQKSFLRWHPPLRDYGYFAAVKLTPADKVPSFVVVADFVTHIDVIGNDGQNLKVLWSKDVESKLGGKYKACRPLVNSALDVDGDGHTEVLVNLFNDTGDNRWHVMVYEGTSGRVELDAPDVYVYAAEDMDRDGVPELFASATSGRLLPRPAPLFVSALRDGKLARQLTVPGVGMWEFAEVRQLPLNVDTMAADGRRTVRLADVDGDRRRECFVSTATGLSVYGADRRGQFVLKGTLTGPDLHVLGSRPQSDGRAEELLLRASGPAGQDTTLTTSNGRLEGVSCAPRPGPWNPPVVARLSRTAGASLLAQDALGRIVCLPAQPGDKWRPRWTAPGRGITADASGYYGVMAADLDGTGARDVIHGRAGADGTAELVARRGDGTERWVHVFPGFGGAAPPWNTNGLTHWALGRYTGRTGQDVSVSLRRSTMHTNETHVLDGRTGREVWLNPYSLASSETEKRGFGGALTSALDVNADGAEDLLCAYPDEYFAADGKTGKLLFGRWAGEIFPGGWLAYAAPVVGRFLEGGKLGVMWTGGGYRRGMMTVTGEKVWAFDYKDGDGPLPGLADVNGDGQLEGLSLQGKQTTCYDLATGRVRWTWPQHPQGGDAAAADVDGDGREEFVFSSGRHLVALGEADAKPRLAWTLELPAAPSAPALADVNGDGRLEIVVMTRDGFLRTIGQP